jgi:hypothetical protein
MPRPAVMKRTSTCPHNDRNYLRVFVLFCCGSAHGLLIAGKCEWVATEPDQLCKQCADITAAELDQTRNSLQK